MIAASENKEPVEQVPLLGLLVPLLGFAPRGVSGPVLWCPFDHQEAALPMTVLFWRSSATVTDVLDAPSEPPIVQLGHYLPEPCLFSPEQVTEYPHPRELDKELQDQLVDESRWETVDPA